MGGLRPARSRIVAASNAGKCASCSQSMVVVTLERSNGQKVTARTHDDGSFFQWTGGLGG